MNGEIVALGDKLEICRFIFDLSLIALIKDFSMFHFVDIFES